ncbi:hypothetical protein EPI10_011503 [Gossypium australe]|uniref:Uncharacterized protein n=1 Tax=Gossypium australe TaxID=47621 RepID=A0A5B6W8T9_9ROSI|nr:hypothetical protein EPI10_011503 [Gossypium australe]
MEHILAGVEQQITKSMNQMLMSMYMAEENLWHIIGRDVSIYCLEILNECKSLESLNVPNIVPIPKIT